MKNVTKLFSVLMLSGALVVFGCKKDKDEEMDTETQSSSDNFLVESNVNDELKEVDAAATSNNLGKTGPVITIDSSSSPKKMTLDYGETGTLCADGKIRRGKIEVTWTGRYRDTGTEITIRPESFYQGVYKIEGTKVIRNEGRNASGNLYYTVTATGIKVTKPDGSARTWDATRTREWISGEQTLNWNDDVYLLTGSASGTNANGLKYSTRITTPLRVDLGCQYRITAGVIDLTPEGKRTRTVNYGNGDCDNTITVTIGSKTYTIN